MFILDIEPSWGDVMMLCHVDVRWNCVSWGQYCCCTVIFSFVFMVLLLRLNIKSEEKHNLHDFFFPRMEKYKVKIVKFSSRMWNRILYFNWNMRLFLRSEITWGRTSVGCPGVLWPQVVGVWLVSFPVRGCWVVRRSSWSRLVWSSVVRWRGAASSHSV